MIEGIECSPMSYQGLLRALRGVELEADCDPGSIFRVFLRFPVDPPTYCHHERP